MVNVVHAAQNVIDIVFEDIGCSFEEKFWIQDEEGRSISHLFWMLKQIRDKEVVDEKAHRWLGYAQGLAVEKKFTTLNRMKEAVINSK